MIGHATAVQTPHRLVVQVLQQVVIVQGFQVFGNLKQSVAKRGVRGLEASLGHGGQPRKEQVDLDVRELHLTHRESPVYASFFMALMMGV